MKITKLEIQAFRSVQSLKFEFHERLNVLVGVNGAGKSSVLDAVAILLSWMAKRIKQVGGAGRRIESPDDIQNGASQTNLQITAHIQGHDVSWNRVQVREGHRKLRSASNLTAMTEVAKQIQSAITDNSEGVNIPLMAYYPVNRAVLDIPLRIRAKHRFGLLAAYDDALAGGANFRQFFEWFREREDLENELRRDQQASFSNPKAQFPDPQLEAVRTAITGLMPEFCNLTIRRNPLRMEVEKKGKRLTVNQLSDGEKCLIAMVGDLARRMAIANPARERPLEGEGVVLIDEIDLHLHPKWQRMIMPCLLKVFPRCQFIVSTHSPHVVTQVHAESLFLLSQSEGGLVVEKAEESYGKTVERILEDLMGLETTRPDEVEDQLLRLFEMVDVGCFSEARVLIAELVREIGDDPELVKAEMLMRRKEIIGK
ncbi:MAG: AAA family ATPase [Gammaproteobacteria bacterium]|nr:AAA family ATPase [Gammaproteobacteria bacterium]